MTIRTASRLQTVVLVIANILGVLAFAWPFVLPYATGASRDRFDAPLILIGLLVCIGALLFVELGRGGMGPKTVALIGVLGAAMVALRLPGFVAGFSAMFIVVLVAGNAFGPTFGFLLGAVGTFASGLFIGGLGPWLPFQMVAVGWVGMGAGLLPKTSWGVRIGTLAAYGFVTGYLFGMVMNLWEWPFFTSGSAFAWDPAGRSGDEPQPLPRVLHDHVVRVGHVPRDRQPGPGGRAGATVARRARQGRPTDAIGARAGLSGFDR